MPIRILAGILFSVNINDKPAKKKSAVKASLNISEAPFEAKGLLLSTYFCDKNSLQSTIRMIADKIR